MNPFFSKPFTLDSTVRLFLGLLIVVFIVLIFRYLTPILLPFFVAWLFAYILHPVVVLVEDKLRIKNRTFAVILVLLTIISVAVLAFYCLTPIVIKEILRLKDFIILYATDSSYNPSGSWEVVLQRFIIYNHIAEIFEKDSLADVFQSVFPFAQTILNNSLAIVGTILSFFLSALYLFFILKDYRSINSHFIGLIPSKYQEFVSTLMQDLEQGMNNYYRGQFLIVMIVSVLYSIAFYLIDMPIGLLMGILIGVLNIIPYLQIIGIPPCILLMLVHSADTGVSPIYSLFLLFVAFVVVQIIQDGFLVPKIMGQKMGLNAAIILLSLSIFGMLFGVVGLIIALPITTLLLSYYKRYILKKINDNSQPKEVDLPSSSFNQ